MSNKYIGKSKEDYLETVLILNQEKGWCREVDIARARHFSKPSVSIAITKLENEGYVIKEDTGAIKLTDIGYKIASETLSKHNLLKSLLKLVGVDEDTAEDEACLIEHSLSDDTYHKIKNYLHEHFPTLDLENVSFDK